MRTLRRNLSTSAAAALLTVWTLVATGCGSDTTTGDTAAPDAGDGTGGDTSTGDTPAADGDVPPVTPGTPILERTPELRFDCTVGRAIANHSPLQWERNAHALVTTAGGPVFLARVESAPANPFESAPKNLRLSTFAPDGAFGPAIDIAANADTVSGLAAAPAGTGFLVVWADGSLRAALHDAAGAPLEAPRTLAAPAVDERSIPTLAALGDAFGLAYSAPGGTSRAVQFVRLDATGLAVGEPRAFATQGDDWDDPAPIVAAGSGRFGLLWQETREGRGHVYFAAVDAAGAVVVPRTRISTTDEDNVTTGWATFGQARVALTATAEGFLTAWPEIRTGADGFSGASAIIRVARLDPAGRVLEEAPVRAAVVDRDEVQPVFLPFEGAMGLFWSSGSHIYICAGCIPDHSVQFVLLDPETLVPQSAVVSVPPTAGGLLGLTVAASGADLLFTTEIGFHVHSEPGSAALRCTAHGGAAQ